MATAGQDFGETSDKVFPLLDITRFDNYYELVNTHELARIFLVELQIALL